LYYRRACRTIQREIKGTSTYDCQGRVIVMEHRPHEYTFRVGQERKG